MMKRGNPNVRNTGGRGPHRKEWTLRKEYNIRYDDTWREIMKEVSDELGWIPYDDVVRINTAFWKWVSEMMARAEMVTIRMVYLGKLVPSAKMLRRYCANAALKIETMYRRAALGIEDRGIENVRKMSAHLEVLQKSYLRLMKEEEEGRRLRSAREKVVDATVFEKVRGDRRRLITERMHEARERRRAENGSEDGTDNHRGFAAGIMYDKYKKELE